MIKNALETSMVNVSNKNPTIRNAVA